MNPELLIAMYGTDNVDTIVQKKSTEKQTKSFSSGSTKGISLSADECKKLCKLANNIEYHPGYENRIRQYTISTEDIDRHGDVVRASGAVFENYLKNPVIQFAHNYSLPPVGVSLKTWIDKGTKSVKSWALFFGDEIDTSGRSDLIFRYVKANAMNASSIGFNPIEARRPNEKEREKLGMDAYGVIFDKWDLLEFSPVPVPANQNAVQFGIDNEVFRGNLESILHSGDFTSKDVDILRKEHIFDDWIVDEFIKELDKPKFTQGGIIPDDLAHQIKPEKILSTDELFSLKVGNIPPNVNDHHFVVDKSISERYIDSMRNAIGEFIDSIKNVIPHKKYELAEESAEWNASEEIKKADVDKLKIMCTWYDEKNKDSKGAYKLPHHTADDYKTVWNGVKAAMGALLGARGGVDIPESDRKSVYNHLSKHYKEFDKEPPEFKEIEKSVPDANIKTEIELGINEVRALLKEMKDGALRPPTIQLDTSKIEKSLDDIISVLTERIDSVTNKLDTVINSLQKTAESNDGIDLYDIDNLSDLTDIKL